MLVYLLPRYRLQTQLRAEAIRFFLASDKKKIHATHDVIAFLRHRHVCSTKIRLTYLILNSVSNLTEEKAQKIPFKKIHTHSKFLKRTSLPKMVTYFGQISLYFKFAYQAGAKWK